ncbi:hypothetical protein C1Y63_06185 [Corynebacterium sp. 13CS0277]|uniref:hypothetical protein n=1 Tax=Corynebacterium sp. 13CS0277 TaxID=2071994 RepID=UPI000D03326C|nr:hypothetical protein [Corynebacterium sp. 13CS0277]PRQ11436.1 hypothetical protein C1Y63_06185 [Corynebacterium sp. 13CS0277]
MKTLETSRTKALEVLVAVLAALVLAGGIAWGVQAYRSAHAGHGGHEHGRSHAEDRDHLHGDEDPLAPSVDLITAAEQATAALWDFQPSIDATKHDANVRVASRYLAGELREDLINPGEGWRGEVPSPRWQAWARSGDHVLGTSECEGVEYETKNSAWVDCNVRQFVVTTTGGSIPYAPFPMRAFMEQGEDGTWYMTRLQYPPSEHFGVF